MEQYYDHRAPEYDDWYRSIGHSPSGTGPAGRRT